MRRINAMQKVKSIFRGVLIFAFFLVILLANAQAQASTATIIEYSSRSAFAAAVPTVLVQGWDSYKDGDTFSNGSSDEKGIKYYSSFGNAMVDTVKFVCSTWPGDLGQTIDGYFYSIDTIRFVFPTPILAFGIDVATNSQTYAAYQATTNLGDVAKSSLDPFPKFNYATGKVIGVETTGQFIGFTSSEAFSEVTIALCPGAPD